MRNFILKPLNQNLVNLTPLRALPRPPQSHYQSPSLPFISSLLSLRRRTGAASLGSSQRENHNQAEGQIMGVSKEELESSLTSKLSPSHLEVVDTSGGCGASFMVEIVSRQFEGKRLLERHRMVNAALEKEMKDIHALSIRRALTPEQWKQLQETENQPAS